MTKRIALLGTTARAVLLFGMLAVAGPALADFDDGAAAYEAGDYAQAMEQWRPLAEDGNAEAQYWVGRLFEQGQGVPASLARAAMWFRLAAGQENSQAQAALDGVLETLRAREAGQAGGPTPAQPGEQVADAAPNSPSATRPGVEPDRDLAFDGPADAPGRTPDVGRPGSAPARDAAETGTANGLDAAAVAARDAAEAVGTPGAGGTDPAATDPSELNGGPGVDSTIDIADAAADTATEYPQGETANDDAAVAGPDADPGVVADGETGVAEPIELAALEDDPIDPAYQAGDAGDEAAASDAPDADALTADLIDADEIALDEAALDETALDSPAVDETAVDDAAIGDLAALDEEALTETNPFAETPLPPELAAAMADGTLDADEIDNLVEDGVIDAAMADDLIDAGLLDEAALTDLAEAGVLDEAAIDALVDNGLIDDEMADSARAALDDLAVADAGGGTVIDRIGDGVAQLLGSDSETAGLPQRRLITARQ